MNKDDTIDNTTLDGFIFGINSERASYYYE